MITRVVILLGEKSNTVMHTRAPNQNLQPHKSYFRKQGIRMR